MARCPGRLTALLVAIWAVVVAAAPIDAQVRWRNPGLDRPANRAAAAPGEALRALAAPGRHPARVQRVVITFERPLITHERDALADAGVRVLTPLGGTAFFASIDRARLDPDRAVLAAPLASVEPVRRDWKLHPDLAAGVIHDWMVVADDRRHTPDRKADGAEPDTVVALCIVFHRDADLDAEATRLVERAGGRVVSAVHSINTVVAHVPWSQLTAIADADAVMSVEPPLPAMGGFNAGVRALTGADQVQGPPDLLDGSGVRVLVYDVGQVFGHEDFDARLTIGASDIGPFSDHATHVAGTVAGSGLRSAGLHRGTAPGAEIISYTFRTTTFYGWLYTDPGDLEQDYAEGIAVHGADLSNNSIGTNVSSNGFPCDWEGDYGATSALIDAIVCGSLGEPFRVVWAAGNERASPARCGPTYHTIPPPVTAKNPVAVGSVQSNNDSVSSFSGWGPTDDGRMKPDIVAPGCQTGGDSGVTSTSVSGAYSVKCGTSMAAPGVAGIVALLLQEHRALAPGAPDPLNSTVKALLAHTAVDLGPPGPDYQSGYGSVRAPAALAQLRTRSVREETVGQDGVWAAAVVVPPGASALRLTLAWDDPPAAPNVIPSLVNDLDLVVHGPSGQRAYPWTLGGVENPDAPAAQTQPNRTDNIEQVLVLAPEPGTWRVEVRGHNIPEGAQVFSLATSPDLVHCDDAGFVVLNRASYSCDDEAVITVVDCGLNTDPLTAETVGVIVRSTSDPIGFAVTLTETGPDTAEFVGIASLSGTASGGALLVADADTLDVIYDDDDPTGQGGGAVQRSAQAIIDCEPPLITDVVISDVGFARATVSFVTSEPARASVWIGALCAEPERGVGSAVLRTEHAITVLGLTPETDYRFEVRARDASLNEAADSNAGACYAFTTAPSVDYFTQMFESGNDLAFTSLTFYPAETPDGYTACAAPASELPVGTETATFVELPDDQPPLTVPLDGVLVRLHGLGLDRVIINPNGYLNFTTPDDIRVESFDLHFLKLRVSMLMDDLDPSAGGQVCYEQRPDRFVVTFIDVPQYGEGDRNTFQCELFYDGRIRLTYLHLDARDGLIGLSPGGGLPLDFFQSDLSHLSSGCDPRPPVSAPSVASTDFAEPVAITLIASDDGHPSPPGALGFVITSLPAGGHLVDPGAGMISQTPYTLTGFGDSVIYSPIGLFQGEDTFTFLAHDSGEPPGGGASAESTVTVTVGKPIPIYRFLFDDQDPGWTMQGLWAFGTPTGSGGFGVPGGRGAPDPTAGFTGSNVLGYNLSGNYPNSMFSPQYLVTGPLDFSGAESVVLRFRRWLGVDEFPSDVARIEVSSDGQTWHQVWQNWVGAVADSAWTECEYDLTPWAAGRDGVRVRWVMGWTDETIHYCGWNLDDIEFGTRQPLTPCIGDANFDRAVDLGDLVTILDNWGRVPATRREGDANNDARVDFTDIIAVLEAWGAQCTLP